MRLNVCTRLHREASITISSPRDTTDAFNIRLEYKPVLSRFVGGYPSPYISAPQSQNNWKSLIAKDVAAIEAYLDIQGRDAKREPWLIPRPKRHRFFIILTHICSSHPRAIPAVAQFLALLPPGYTYPHIWAGPIAFVQCIPSSYQDTGCREVFPRCPFPY